MKGIQDRLGIKNMFDFTIKTKKANTTLKGLQIGLQTREYKKFGKYFIAGEKYMLVREDLALQIIMNCGTSRAIKIRTKLGVNQHDIVMI